METFGNHFVIHFPERATECQGGHETVVAIFSNVSYDSLGVIRERFRIQTNTHSQSEHSHTQIGRIEGRNNGHDHSERY